MALYDCDANHFAEQVTSLRSQDFENWTCLISDDGSSAELRQKIAQLLEEDKRFIHHVQKRNLGSYRNFEYGIDYFSKDSEITHIALSDQDDIWRRDKLTRLLDEIEFHGALLAHSDLELIDEGGRTLHPSVWQYEKRQPEKLDYELLLLRNTVTGCTTMIRCSLIPHILPFPKQSQAGCWHHDHWIALVAAHLGKIAHVRESLVRYRQHGCNLVGAKKHVGTIRNEFALWIAKKGKITLQSYHITRDLSHALYQRSHSSLDAGVQGCFPNNDRIDFGFSILRLGLRSFLVGYGAQGTILRLLFNKIVLDLIKVKRALLQRSLLSRS